LDGLPRFLPGATRDDLELAKRALSAALEQVAVGSRQMVEAVRDQAVVKMREVINQRHEAAEQARKKSAAESRLDPLMTHVDKFIDELVRCGDLEFEDFNDRRETTEALKKKIRPLLLKELIAEPGMSDERLRRRIEKLADKPLDALMAS
jgi:polyhydroxyalkanoate synthesis regulator phasin